MSLTWSSWIADHLLAGTAWEGNRVLDCSSTVATLDRSGEYGTFGGSRRTSAQVTRIILKDGEVVFIDEEFSEWIPCQGAQAAEPAVEGGRLVVEFECSRCGFTNSDGGTCPICVGCQIGSAEQAASLTCQHLDSGGVRCEETQPHQGHSISPHTIEHALLGNGYTCAAVEGIRAGRR